jgi:phospholipid-transporting ATPase
MLSEYSLASTAPYESTEMLDRSNNSNNDIEVKPTAAIVAKKKSSFFPSFFSNRKNNKSQMDDVPRIINIQNGLQNQFFLGNQVSTAKYNPLSFLPKFLHVEFSKSANLFFLFISGIQVIEDQ